MSVTLRKISAQEAEALWESSEYTEYIMDHAHGDRVICNGDTLLAAMEDHYLWDDFLDSLGLEE
jgi:hypothetical protein